MCIRDFTFVLCFSLLFIKLPCSFGANEKDKILLISAEYVPYDIIISPDINLSTFRNFLNESCLLKEISLEDFNSSADVHSAILSGGLYRSSNINTSSASICDEIIHSKLSPHFEPLWLTNQRQGMSSGSFYWPDDFVAVNKSRPAFTAGSIPAPRNAYFDTEVIYRWLLNPSITFMSIYIPPPPVLRGSQFVYNYIEYVNEFLSTLLSTIKTSPELNCSVSIVFIGGTAVVNNQDNVKAVSIRQIFKHWPLSAFGSHFKQTPLLEFWPTPDELEEDDMRLLDEQNPYFFSCSTTEFRKQNPNLDTGLLPPYYLVARSGKVLRVSFESHEPEITPVPQSRPFVLLWGKAFTTSPEVCGFSQSTSKTLNSSFQLYDIYPMVCWALGLQKPWINWGKLSRVKKYFKNQPLDIQIAEFEGRYRDWSNIKEDEKIGFTATTLISGGFIAALALALAITFIACALKYHCRYNSPHPVSNNMLSFRYHKRRIQRPWVDSASPSTSHSHRGLLGNHRDGSGFALDESEEEEVLMANDLLSAREHRKRRKEGADAFIQMLHSPTGSRSAPSLARA